MLKSILRFVSKTCGMHGISTKDIYLERYRSGHNEAVLKTVCPKGRMGSNPILSVKRYRRNLELLPCTVTN